MTTLNIKISLEEDDKKRFIEKCISDGVDPEEVIQGFINDLITGDHSHGSDERDMAQEYYDRCGYGFFLKGEYRTFAQWLLREYGNYALKEIIGNAEDIKIFEEEIDYLEEHPEICEEGEIEDLTEEIKNSMEEIKLYYKEYANEIEKPDSLDQGIISIYEYIAKIEEN